MLKKIKTMTKLQKILSVIFIMLFGLTISIGIPTLARYKNRNTLLNTSVWDGTIATSYKSGNGSEENPYIISNGSELAYFSEQLLVNNYENTYFNLEKDIVLNNGIFEYNESSKYILNDVTYYLDGNKYYSDQEQTIEVGNVNTITPLDNFKGHFNGQFFRIYGLYINNQNNHQTALFTNLKGKISNLYVENSLIIGGGITGGISSNTNGAELTNVLYDGFVIGSSLSSSQSLKLSNLTINAQNFITTGYIQIDDSFLTSEISSTTIKGNVTINNPTGNEIIEVNGTSVSNSFEVSLGNGIVNQVPVTVESSADGTTVTLSNLQYVVQYNNSVSGGIAAISKDTNYINVINKGYVYSEGLSGGLIGISNGTTGITNSYNNGSISSSNGGLIGKSYQDIATITRSYSTSNGLINNVQNSTVNVIDSFNTSDVYCIGISSDSNVNVTNSYYTSTSIVNNSASSSFNFIAFDTLLNETNMLTNMTYNKFVSFEDLSNNQNHVWIYEELPILFFDDLNDPLAKIYADAYSWDSLSFDLNTIKLNSSIAFTIQKIGDLNRVKQIKYYMANKLLTKEEIDGIQDWTDYTNYVQITEEGTYVIYAKIIDFSDKIQYINTDLLIIDSSNPLASISLENNTWTSYKSNLDEIYIDNEKNITVEATDLSGIKTIKYYITDKLLNIKQLNQINDWTNYQDVIKISEIGKYIVYVKVIDNNDYTTYINTDYLIYDGYVQNSFHIGKNNSYSNNLNITSDSSVTTNISYSKNTSLSSHTHNVMTNILLPVGAKIVLYDNTNNKTYEYQITDSNENYNFNDSCGELESCQKKATYPFTLFKEVGTGNVEKKYTESNAQVNENFTIVVDLKSVDAVINYSNVKVFIELHNSEGKNVRPTLQNGLTGFNIYSNSKAELNLTTDFEETINYDSDSSFDIVLNSALNYKQVGDNEVIDTTYEGKSIGLAIKIFNSNNELVDEKEFKNFVFKIGNNNYYPENDGVIYINLNNGINKTKTTLNLSTYKGNNEISVGTYYLKIYNYVSYNGHYYEELGEDVITVPIVVADKNKIVYGFDVFIDDEDRIIDKSLSERTLLFKVIQNGDLVDPNVQVSLYKKTLLTAYDQNYSIVDLKNYITNNLTSAKGNVYYALTDPIEYNQVDKYYNEVSLNLNINTFEKTSYKFVFDLYDGTKKVGTINKYFIIK